MTTRPSAPPAVRWITRTLEEAGHETWAVGGAVRDACVGRPSGDWDFATHARPAQVRRLFRRTVPIGMDHGTVGVLARDGTLYEVTTFRRDVETDGRHAVVAFAETLDEDLARRDFTINAVAWHALREELYDPFDGLGDLRRGLLRTVGDPGQRFTEDFLRILRAFRFAGRFSLEIEPATWEAACAGVDRLTGLSAERIREELVKVLDADPDPTTSLRLYADSGALRVLYPELEATRRTPVVTGSEGSAGIGSGRGEPEATEGPTLSRWSLAVRAVAQLPVGRPWLRLAALLRVVPPDAAAALLLRLRLSNQQVDRIARLASAAALPPSDAGDEHFRRWLSRHGPRTFPAVARIELAFARARVGLDLDGPERVEGALGSWRRARTVRAQAPPLTVGELALDGRGLISLGMKPGPHFGRILEALLDWVLEDPSRNETTLLRQRALESCEEERSG